MVSWWKVIFHTFTQRRLAIEKHILNATIRMDAANGHHQQKSILFLHHIWPQRSLFESRVIPSAKRTSIREKIYAGNIGFLENNLTSTKPQYSSNLLSFSKQVGESLVGSRRTVEHEESGFVNFSFLQRRVSFFKLV